MIPLAESSGAWGVMILNGPCLARLLEGSLGNSQVSESASLGDTLTLAQRVLIAKIAEKLAKDLEEAIRKETGLKLVPSPGRAIAGDDEDIEEFADGLFLDLSLEGEGDAASIVVGIRADALNEAVRENEEQDTPKGDPRVADALMDVEVPLVAELGRISLGLRRVIGLEVGQILRLPTLVENPVPLSIAGIPKFQVSPVTSRGQLAVQIVRRHGT
jgi:flagellar motor switch/type III secretory pathway protein FliN